MDHAAVATGLQGSVLDRDVPVGEPQDHLRVPGERPRPAQVGGIECVSVAARVLGHPQGPFRGTVERGGGEARQGDQDDARHDDADERQCPDHDPPVQWQRSTPIAVRRDGALGHAPPGREGGGDQPLHGGNGAG